MVHLSREQIKRYTDRTCGADELFFASQHLAECDDCRKQFLTSSHIEIVHSALKTNIELPEEEFEHPTYEDIERYVDGTLEATEKGILEMHFDDCAECGAIERDLRRLRMDLEAQPVSRQQPYVSQSTMLKAAVIAACSLLLFAIGWLIPIRSRVRSLESQIIDLEKQKVNLQKTSQDLRNQMAVLQQQSVKQMLPSDQRVFITKAMTTGALEIPDSIQRLIGTRGQLMGTSQDKQFTLLRPVGTFVESRDPTFEWTPITGAQSYTVSVYDLNFRPVTQSPPLTQTKWQLPMKLSRGKEYAWQVIAVKNGVNIKSPLPPEPPAMFGIISADEYAQFENLRSMKVSHLVNGILLARYGLLEDAEGQFNLARTQTPSDSEAAEKFLKQIQSLRRKN